MAKKEIRISIDGMTCNLCATNIEKALYRVDGVRSVTVHWTTGKALVEFDGDRITKQDVERAVMASGYWIESSTGNGDQGFAGLPLYQKNKTICAIRN